MNFRWEPGFSFFYLLLLAATFFLGSFFGGAIYFLFGFLLFLPLLAWSHLFLTWKYLHFVQNFSNTHPLKGDSVCFSFEYYSGSPLPGCPVALHLIRVTPARAIEALPLHFLPRVRKGAQQTLEILCRYRGTYEMGLQKIVFTDLLGWLQLEIPQETTTFYVTPRILEKNFDLQLQNWGNSLAFQSLEPYRPGTNVRFIDHKHLPLGLTLVRKFEPDSLEEVLVVMDSRRIPDSDQDSVWEDEDLCLEIYLALVRDLLRKEIPLDAWVLGSALRFKGRRLYDFDQFYLRLSRFNFMEGQTPLQEFQQGLRTSVIPKTILLVTHRNDGALWPYLEDLARLGHQIVLFYTGSEPLQSSCLADWGIDVRGCL